MLIRDSIFGSKKAQHIGYTHLDCRVQSGIHNQLSYSGCVTRYLFDKEHMGSPSRSEFYTDAACSRKKIQNTLPFEFKTHRKHIKERFLCHIGSGTKLELLIDVKTSAGQYSAYYSHDPLRNKPKMGVADKSYPICSKSCFSCGKGSLSKPHWCGR